MMEDRERVSIADLNVAAQWLENNEGVDGDETGERAACLRVAAWIDAEIARREENAAVVQLTKVARLNGKSTKGLRERLRAAQENR